MSDKVIYDKNFYSSGTYMKLHIATISIILILGAFSITQGYGTSSNNGINWMKYCNMAPDFLVSEPCDELVDDNNELTTKGEKVLLCIVGKPLGGMAGASIGDPTGLAGGFVADRLLDCPKSSNSGISDGIVGSILSKLLN